jgi:hypothetical protein
MAIQKISAAVIADNSIDADKIAAGAITVADIPDGEIITAKIADGQITSAKMDTNISLSGDLTASSIKATSSRHSCRPSILLDFENSKQISSLIDFSRSSIASYVGSDGYIKCHDVYENLVTYSSSLQNWASGRLSKTQTSETLDPKGTQRATKMLQTDSGSSGYITNDYAQGLDMPTGRYNFSIFVKAGTSSWFSFFDTTMGGQILFMNSANGAFGTDASGGRITNKRSDYCGNGWYRFSFSYDLDSNSIDWNFYFNANSDNTNATTLNTYMYAYGVQMTAGEYLRPYRDSDSGKFSFLNDYPTRAASVHEPRVSHDPVTLESLGFLLEETRTNYFTYGDALSSGWTDIGINKHVNAAYGPDNMFSAMELREDSSTSQHNLQIQSLGTFQGSGSVWTFSVFVKPNENLAANRLFAMRVYGSGNGAAYATYDVVNGTVVSSTGTFLLDASIEEYRDGWYRCIFTGDFDGTNDGWLFGIDDQSGAELPTYTGDDASGFYIWGPQAEIGYFATSYINTFSRGTSVTRASELATINNLDYFSNNDKGISVQVKSKLLSNIFVDYNGHLMTFTAPQEVDGLSSRFVFFYGYSASDVGQVGVAVRNDSGYTFIGNTARTSGFDNLSVRLVENDGAVYINGSQVATDSSFEVYPNSELHIGRGPGDAEYYSGYIKSIRLYNTGLTNAELLELSK